MKAHYGDIGIINIIRQRLKDIELQRWLREINNDTRKDANQGNKMRTYTTGYSKRQTITNVKTTYIRSPIHDTIALTKLRLSNHKLAIETGRYSTTLQQPYFIYTCITLTFD